MSPLLAAIVIGGGFAACLLGLMFWLRSGVRNNDASTGNTGADGAVNTWVWGSMGDNSSGSDGNSCESSSDAGGSDSCGSDGGGGD